MLKVLTEKYDKINATSGSNTISIGLTISTPKIPKNPNTQESIIFGKTTGTVNTFNIFGKTTGTFIKINLVNTLNIKYYFYSNNSLKSILSFINTVNNNDSW